MDMLGAEMPIIRQGIRRVLYWRDAEQLLDFTTKDDVAAYTAAAALDDTTPRLLRIAGDSVGVREIAAKMTEVSGRRYRPLWAGSIGLLGAAFPPWQGMQSMRDQFSGRVKLTKLDNDRYPGLRWATVHDHLKRLFTQSGAPSSTA